MSPSEQSNDAGNIQLPSHLDHATSGALRPQIEALRGMPIAFDASAVAFLGGAGAELLLATQAEWQDAGQSFSIREMSEEFVTGLTVLGLHQSALFNEGNE